MNNTKTHLEGQEHIKVGMGETERELEFIEISKIDVVANPRTESDEQRFQALCASVKRLGILQPIMVAKVADSDRYTVIAGQRRFEAAKEVGLGTVPAQITAESEVAASSERLSRALVENMVREDMTPVDEAMAFAELQRSHGLNEKGIAELLSVTAERVKDRLGLLSLPESVQELVDKREISLQNAATLRPIAKQAPRVAAVLAERVVGGSQSARGLDDDPAAALRSLADVEISIGDDDEDLFVLPFGERDSVNLHEVISRVRRVIAAGFAEEQEEVLNGMQASLTSASNTISKLSDELAVVAVNEADVDRARAYGGLIEYSQGAHKRSGVLTDPVFAADWAEDVARREFGALTPEQLDEKSKEELEDAIDAVQEEKKRRQEERYAADMSNKYLGDRLKRDYDFDGEVTMDMAVTLTGLVMDTYGREIARTIGIVRDDFMIVDEARAMGGGKKRITSRQPQPDEALEKMEEILAGAKSPDELISRMFGFVSAAVFADRRALPESRRGNRFPLPISTGNKETIPGQVRGAIWDEVATKLTKERAEELEESFAPSDEGRPSRDRLAREDGIDLESAATDQKMVGESDDLGIEGLDLDLDTEDEGTEGIDLGMSPEELESLEDDESSNDSVPFPDPEPAEVS